MFLGWSKPLEWSARGAIAVGWLGIGISGVGGTFYTGRSVAAVAEPTWLLIAGSAVSMIGGILGLVGIIVGGLPALPRWWRFEWVGASVAGAGIVYYVSIPWWYVISGQPERLQQSGALLATLSGFILFRVIHCIAYGQELTKRHAAAVAVSTGGVRFDG